MPRNVGSEELYRLIHSLTPEEKGYFKKFSLRHTAEGNKYLQLFEAISNQKEFEEVSLKKKYKDLSDLKGYLFEMILSCMLLYTSEPNEQVALLKTWFHIQFLYKKGLADKAIQLNRQAIKMANETEHFWLENQFLRIQNDMEKHGWQMAERGKKHRQFFDDLKTAKNKQEERDEYFELDRIFVEASYDQTFRDDRNKTFAKNLPLHLLDENVKTKSIRAEKLRLGSRVRYFQLLKNHEEAYRASMQFYLFEKKLWEENHPMRNYVYRSLSIRELVQACLLTKRASESFPLIEEMRLLPSKIIIQKAENDLCSFTYALYAYWQSCQHKQGEEFLASQYPRELIKKYGSRFKSYMMEINRQKLLFEFSNRNYKKVFVTMADFEALGIKKDARYYYKCCELMRILLQVELKEYQLLPSLISNAIKHLELTPAEITVLQTIKKITAVNRHQKLKELEEKLPVGKDKILLFNSLSINTWLSSLVSNKSIAETIRANNYEL